MSLDTDASIKQLFATVLALTEVADEAGIVPDDFNNRVLRCLAEVDQVLAEMRDR